MASDPLDAIAAAPAWIEALPPHSVDNVGSTDLHIIAVEVKR